MNLSKMVNMPNVNHQSQKLYENTQPKHGIYLLIHFSKDSDKNMKQKLQASCDMCPPKILPAMQCVALFVSNLVENPADKLFLMTRLILSR